MLHFIHSLLALLGWLVAGPVAEAVEPGFAALFDGSSFAGWQGAVDGYKIVDGELRCQPGAGGKLITTEEYGDFVLRFEFRLTPGSNNGLGIRVPVGDGDGAYTGMELQILDDAHEKYAAIKPWQMHGSIYGVVPAEQGSLRLTGEWNEEEVTADGSRIRVVVNGRTIVDADLTRFRDGQPTIDEQKHPGLSRARGHIGFLGHGDEVHFRNIRIKARSR